MEAINEEKYSLKKNGTLNFVDRLKVKGKKVLCSKCIFKVKPKHIRLCAENIFAKKNNTILKWI